MRDYHRYRYSIRELILHFLMAAVLTALVSWLFYDAVYGLILVVPLFVVLLKIREGPLCDKQKKELTIQFKDAIGAVATALNAGYSVENAWRESLAEEVRQYGKSSLIAEELKAINNKLSVNEPLEPLLMDLADRSDIDDIRTFCQIFVFAKRGGGDFVGIIKATSDRIARKAELERTLDTDLSSRKLEARIMNLMPMGILAYLKITTPDYFDVLYHNVFGVIVMTVCLGIYVVGYALSEKMLRIVIEV